jgi:hypothetical protein
MSSKYRKITEPSSDPSDFQIGDLVKTRDSYFFDDIYGWLSPGELGIVQEVVFFEITDYFNIHQSVHKICELKIYWPKTKTTTYSVASGIVKLTKEESDVNL